MLYTVSHFRLIPRHLSPFRRMMLVFLGKQSHFGLPAVNQHPRHNTHLHHHCRQITPSMADHRTPPFSKPSLSSLDRSARSRNVGRTVQPVPCEWGSFSTAFRCRECGRPLVRIDIRNFHYILRSRHFLPPSQLQERFIVLCDRAWLLAYPLSLSGDKGPSSKSLDWTTMFERSRSSILKFETHWMIWKTD